MKLLQPKFKMVAKTLAGLEEILADELTSLGATDVRKMIRTVEFKGDIPLMCRVNLWSRLCTRILVPLGSGKIRRKEELYDIANDINWYQLISPDATISVDAIIHNSILSNSMYAAQIVKDGVVDRFRQETGRRPSVEPKWPDLRINLHLVNNRATISFDSSGESLNRRGYRRRAGAAPLGEVLAAGIIELTGWNGTDNFFDGMTGSGTLPVEAAMKACNIAPGSLGRKFGFQKLSFLDQTFFEKTVVEAKEMVKTENLPLIRACDIEPKHIKIAKGNAERATVANVVEFEASDFFEAIPSDSPGIVILNPPYGERIEVDDLDRLYGLIGDRLKSTYSGYTAYILTGNMKSAKRIGLRTSRKIELYNGPIECRLLKFDLYQGSRKRTEEPTD